MTVLVRIVLFLCACMSPIAAQSLTPIPIFRAERVLPANESYAIPLGPGLIMSIYGDDLGPVKSCIAYADQHKREQPSPLLPDPQFANTLIYPKVLCSTEVTVAGLPAGLLYVSANQVNFKVPQEIGITGTAELRVVFSGRASEPVAMPLGLETTTLSLEQPGYVSMPVWFKVRLPYPQKIGSIYPSVLGSARFGCYAVEVRKNGILLPHHPGSNWDHGGIHFAGNICGSYQSASPSHLPLHLLYNFYRPGIYQVRFWVSDKPLDTQPPGRVTFPSDWTDIEILPAEPDRRAAFLAELRVVVNVTPTNLIADLLPSLFGFPDDASFDLLARYLYDPDPQVRRFAAFGLNYWSNREVIPKLEWLLKTRGPNKTITGALTVMHLIP